MKITEVLREQSPELIRMALDRLSSGKSLFVSGNKLRDGLSPDSARLVLMLSIHFFTELTGYPGTSFRLSKAEERLLGAIMTL